MKKLNELKNFKGVQGPVVTIVMDGVGIAPDTLANAVAGAYTPTLDMLMKDYPMGGQHPASVRRLIWWA